MHQLLYNGRRTPSFFFPMGNALVIWFLAAATFAGSVLSMILLTKRSRLASISAVATGVSALYFFSSLPVLMMSGVVVSLLATELGLVLCVIRLRFEHREVPRKPKSLRVRPPAYYLSDSGVWRIHQPVEYLSDSGVWRRRPVISHRLTPRLRMLR